MKETKKKVKSVLWPIILSILVGSVIVSLVYLLAMSTLTAIEH